MAGTFPNSPDPIEAKIRGIYASARISTAHSDKRKRCGTGAQRWAIDFFWRNLSRVEIVPIFAFYVKQEGQLGSFQVVIHIHFTPLGAWLGTPKVKGAVQTIKHDRA